MIKMEDLEKIQKYLESRQIQDDFYCASEKERIQLLEYLEKLMDLGEMADEIATGFIFRRSSAKQGAPH